MTTTVSGVQAAALRLVEREYRVRLEFTETLLGSRPTESIAARWVQARETDAAEATLRSGRRALPTDGGVRRATPDEARDLAADLVGTSTAGEGREADEDDAGAPLAVTGFSTDPVTGRLHLWDFQLMGFLKAVAGSQTLDLRIPGKVTADKSANAQIQRLVWVFGVGDDPMERRIWLRRADGSYIDAPEPELMDRPLRAQTPRGERVSIAISEQIHPPCWCEARVVLLRGCKVSQAQLEEVFAYGMFQGLGQWRSGGWGRFVAELEQVR